MFAEAISTDNIPFTNKFSNASVFIRPINVTMSYWINEN